MCSLPLLSLGDGDGCLLSPEAGAGEFPGLSARQLIHVMKRVIMMFYSLTCILVSNSYVAPLVPCALS